jgi:hypothetical protein
MTGIIREHNLLTGYRFVVVEYLAVSLGLGLLAAAELAMARWIDAAIWLGIVANCLVIAALALDALRCGQPDFGTLPMRRSAFRRTVSRDHPHLMAHTLALVAITFVPWALVVIVGAAARPRRGRRRRGPASGIESGPRPERLQARPADQVRAVDEPVARPLHGSLDLGGRRGVAGYAQVQARPRLEDGDPATWSQPVAQAGEVALAIGQVMVARREEDEVDRLGQARVRFASLDGTDLRQVLALGGPHDFLAQIRIGVDRVDDAARADQPGEVQGECAEAGADVGHPHPGPHPEPGHDPLALAPGMPAVRQPLQSDAHGAE